LSTLLVESRSSSIRTIHSPRRFRNWKSRCPKKLVYQNVEIKNLTKKLGTSNELTKQFNEKLEAFAKQAKDQYRKYDSYLDNAEEVLNYTTHVANQAFEVIDAIFSNAILAVEFDFAATFKPEQSIETETKIKKIIEKFSKSDFLKKKKLFLDLQKKISFKEKFNIKEVQQKYDKFLSQLKQTQQSTQRSLGQSTRQNFLTDVFSLIADGGGNIMQIETPSPGRSLNIKELEGCVYQHLVGLVHGLISTKGLLDSHPHYVIEPEILKELMIRVSDLMDTFKAHFIKLKNNINLDEESIPKADSDVALIEAEFAGLNAEISRLHSKIADIEQLEYSKLLDLREENNKLLIVRNHINGLTVENQKIQEKIRKNEFSLLELDSIILAYEKNIKEKEEVNFAKEKQLAEARQYSQDLNHRISELLAQILGRVIRNRRRDNDLREDIHGQSNRDR